MPDIHLPKAECLAFGLPCQCRSMLVKIERAKALFSRGFVDKVSLPSAGFDLLAMLLHPSVDGFCPNSMVHPKQRSGMAAVPRSSDGNAKAGHKNACNGHVGLAQKGDNRLFRSEAYRTPTTLRSTNSENHVPRHAIPA